MKNLVFLAILFASFNSNAYDASVSISPALDSAEVCLYVRDYKPICKDHPLRCRISPGLTPPISKC